MFRGDTLTSDARRKTHHVVVILLSEYPLTKLYGVPLGFQKVHLSSSAIYFFKEVSLHTTTGAQAPGSLSYPDGTSVGVISAILISRATSDRKHGPLFEPDSPITFKGLSKDSNHPPGSRIPKLAKPKSSHQTLVTRRRKLNKRQKIPSKEVRPKEVYSYGIVNTNGLTQIAEWLVKWSNGNRPWLWEVSTGAKKR